MSSAVKRAFATVGLVLLALPILAWDDNKKPTGEFSATGSIDTPSGTRSMPFNVAVISPRSLADAQPLKKVLEDGGQQALVNAIRGSGQGQIKFGALEQNYNYRTGQFLGPAPANAESQYRTNVKNDTLTASWKYAKPDDRILDFENTVYWTQTKEDQLKIANGTSTSKGNAITGFIGDSRNFKIETAGFDTHNTSRFDIGPVRNALTYGGDYFKDRVNVIDATGTADLFTPSGEREVYGAFVQWRANYSTWFEMINAARYDAFKLSGGNIKQVALSAAFYAAAEGAAVSVRHVLRGIEREFQKMGRPLHKSEIAAFTGALGAMS